MTASHGALPLRSIPSGAGPFRTFPLPLLSVAPGSVSPRTKKISRAVEPVSAGTSAVPPYHTRYPPQEAPTAPLYPRGARRRHGGAASHGVGYDPENAPDQPPGPYFTEVA
jgi:hypothetical protein